MATVKFVKNTPENLALAAKYEKMTDAEWKAFDRRSEKEGRVVRDAALEEGIRMLDNRRKRMVSMRIDPAIIRLLKAKAEKVGIPYQTLAASVLKRYAEGNLDIMSA
ncbi:MAG: BrnA antitoxin family protein [Fibrobacteraceae bacterium]|nr:BrnA antitoxin family protein [Fibrobacteraceae bacterium]